MLEQWMEKLSEEIGLDAPLKAQIPNVYVIPLDEGYSVTISNPSPSHYLFSSTLGPCPDTGKEAFFTQLLLANLFGQGTHGAVLGMDIDATVLTLTQDIDHPIEYREFKDTVEDFINAADFWREEALSNETLQ